MNQDHDEQFDVAIVGYGPVGQLLALLLARRGHRIAAIERWPEPFALPRAVHYDHEVARIFQAAGVVDEMQAISGTADEVEFLGAQRQLLFKFKVSGTSQSGWPFANGFAQPDLEKVLDTAVKSCPNVTLMRGWEATDVQQSDSEAVVELRRTSPVSGEGEHERDAIRSVHAKFVIGADGANSFVQRKMDNKFVDLGFAFDWLVVNLRWKPGNERDFGIQNICDPARPTSVVPGGPGRRRWEFMLLPGETAEEMNREEVAWDLLSPWGVSAENSVLERHAVYTFRAGWADRWRDGRLLLAGDSAHLMPPFMGQGMCSGMRDAMTLSWQLDLVLRGAQPPTLLESYGSERLDHVRALIFGSVEHGKLICMSDPVAAAERDARMEAANSNPALAPPPPPPPRLGAGIVMDGNSHGGLLSFQGIVEANGTRGLFDDVIGRGFVLIGTAINPETCLSPTNRQFLDSIGAIVAHVSPLGPVHDIDDGYAEWFAANGYVAALVRPDFYLFGAAVTAAAVNDLVDALRTKLDTASGIALVDAVSQNA